MRIPGLVVLASCLLMADSPRSQRDPQSTSERRSAPGTGQEYLGKFAGDWHVSKTFYPRAGEPVLVKGRCRQAMIHDGRFLQSDFIFDQDGKATTGLGIIGFEPESGTFTSFWTDSRQTRMSVRQSRDRFSGDEIVLYSRSLDGDGKESQRSKTVTRLEEDGAAPGRVGRHSLLLPVGDFRTLGASAGSFSFVRRTVYFVPEGEVSSDRETTDSDGGSHVGRGSSVPSTARWISRSVPGAICSARG